ncbi:MAG: hypothetical protein N2C14_09145, partial [Planctomycetales bacterium]
MDPNQVLVWFVAASTIAAGVRTWRVHQFRNGGWLAVYGGILATLGLGLWLWKDQAGYVAAAAWGTFVAAPALASNWQAALIAKGRYAAARRVAQLIAVLHPLDGWWEAPKLMKALELLKRGEREQAERVLQELRRQDRPLGWIARLRLDRLRYDWRAMRDWVEGHPQSDRLLRDPTVIINYLRSLGELGDQETMLRRFADLAPRISRSTQRTSYHAARMMVLALCGRADAVRELFDGPLASHEGPLKTLWTATAL